MNWKQELEEKLKGKKFAEKLGGDERVKRQHNSGRYTIRERIKILCDKSTFHEIGKIAGQANYDGNNDLTDFKKDQILFLEKVKLTEEESL